MVNVTDVTDYYKAKKLCRQQRGSKASNQYFQKIRESMMLNRKELYDDLVKIYEDVVICDYEFELQLRNHLEKNRKFMRIWNIGKILLGILAVGLTASVSFELYNSFSEKSLAKMPH